MENFKHSILLWNLLSRCSKKLEWTNCIKKDKVNNKVCANCVVCVQKSERGEVPYSNLRRMGVKIFFWSRFKKGELIMKKLISLLLAFVLLLGLLVVPTSAASADSSFTDYSVIEHKEAVDYMVYLGIINGIENADGTYRYDPDGHLTRGALAKLAALACTLVEGTITVPDETPAFSDVDGHWAEAYIQWAADNHLIDGVGDGTYAPNETVTGYDLFLSSFQNNQLNTI